MGYRIAEAVHRIINKCGGGNTILGQQVDTGNYTIVVRQSTFPGGGCEGESHG